MRGISVILILILLVNSNQSGSGIGGSEFEERARPGVDQGAEQEEGNIEGNIEGNEGGNEGLPPGHYEDAETCPCTSHTPNMRTVVVKSTWSFDFLNHIGVQ